MTEHKHAAILRAIADGKKLQYQHQTGWQDVVADDIFMSAYKFELGKLRIAPETVLINGVECPKPIRYTAPVRKFVPWCVFIHITGEDGTQFEYTSEADARTVFDALILPFKQEGV